MPTSNIAIRIGPNIGESDDGEGRANAATFADRYKFLKEEAPDKKQFYMGCAALFMGSVGCTIFLGFMLIIPATMITMGALHLDFCPVEPYIPIYLVVAGCLKFLRMLSSIAIRCFMGEEEEDDPTHAGARSKIKIALFIYDFFQLAWLIAGSVWVYRRHGDYSSDSTDWDNYCDSILYLFAFWLITVTWILAGAFLSLVLCYLCIFAICACCMCCIHGKMQSKFS